MGHQASNPVQPLDGSNLAAVIELLAMNSLLNVDLNAQHLANFVGITTDDTLIAIGGLEVYERTALLRSLATHPDFRDRGLARMIVVELERLACRKRIEAIYLLTDTAEKYFENQGYRRSSRSGAPWEIASTAQFSELCSDTATLMVKNFGER
ncbi:MAG: arsenic resistance N-acetyltransferase ArsN2 [Pseudomonadota bacterium]